MIYLMPYKNHLQTIQNDTKTNHLQCHKDTRAISEMLEDHVIYMASPHKWFGKFLEVCKTKFDKASWNED